VNATFSDTAFPTVDQGLAFNLSGVASGGTVDAGYSYLWNFGDGSGSPGPDVSHTYNTPGEYLLTLVATDSVNESGSASWIVQVHPDPSLAIVAGATTVDVNHSVSLASLPSGGTGNGTTTWTFGDGTNGTGLSVTHTWSRSGAYEVGATYTDALGVVGRTTISVQVNSALAGTFTSKVVDAAGASSSVVAGGLVQFNANPSGGSPPYTITWKFGDDTLASGAESNHSYATPGNYTISVSVADQSGAWLNGTLFVSVTPVSVANNASTSAYTFPEGLFLGIIAGAALAAVAVYAVGPRRRKESPPPPPSAYVPPAVADWKED
jgi:hypothetical protein